MKTVLVIDDDKAILDAVRLILEDGGYSVITSENADNVLALIKQHTPSLLLLDIWMPGKSGLEVTAQLKADETTKNLPVVIMSALSEAQKAENYHLANGHLTKPFSIHDLLTTVKAVSA